MFRHYFVLTAIKFGELLFNFALLSIVIQKIISILKTKHSFNL
jgi:hypothetical protein